MIQVVLVIRAISLLIFIPWNILADCIEPSLYSLLLSFLLTSTHDTYLPSTQHSSHQILTSFRVLLFFLVFFFSFVLFHFIFFYYFFSLVEFDRWILVSSRHFINSWTRPSRLSLHWRLAAMAASDSNIFFVISFSFINFFYVLVDYFVLHSFPLLCYILFSIETVFFILFRSTTLH